MQFENKKEFPKNSNAAKQIPELKNKFKYL